MQNHCIQDMIQSGWKLFFHSRVSCSFQMSALCCAVLFPWSDKLVQWVQTGGQRGLISGRPVNVGHNKIAMIFRFGNNNVHPIMAVLLQIWKRSSCSTQLIGTEIYFDTCQESWKTNIEVGSPESVHRDSNDIGIIRQKINSREVSNSPTPLCSQLADEGMIKMGKCMKWNVTDSYSLMIG